MSLPPGHEGTKLHKGIIFNDLSLVKLSALTK
jgi:hypothetical protein